MMNHFLRRSTLALVLMGSLIAPRASFAQPGATKAPAAPAASPATPAAPAAPANDKLAEARRRYERALELSDEGNYDEAILELQRAYQLAPTYRLLYNLGVVSVAVHDYVKAIDYFNRYLSEGGAEIEPNRVTEVQNQISRLRLRMAKLTITVSIPDAEVALDDVPIGHAPIPGPTVINAGRHKVTASFPGYFPATTIIEVVGNETRSVTLTLSRATTAEKASRPIPWLGWGITAALGVGCAITGGLALSAESNYDQKVGTVGESGSDINSAYRKMRTFSITSDVLLGGAIIAGGVSLYFTLKPPKSSKEKAAVLSHVTPAGFAF